MNQPGRERLGRLDVGSVVRTVFLLSVFAAFAFGLVALAAWHAMSALDLIRRTEGLIGKLAGGVFRLDRSDLAWAFLGFQALLVLTVTAVAGVGAAVYNQAAEIAGGVEFVAEDSIRRRDRPIVRAFRKGARGVGAGPAERISSPVPAGALPVMEPHALEEAAATVAAPAKVVLLATQNGRLRVCAHDVDDLSEQSRVAADADSHGRVCLATLSDPTDALLFTEDGHVLALCDPARGSSSEEPHGRPQPRGIESTAPVTILDRQGVSVSAFVLFVTERGRVKRVAGSVCEDAAVAARRVVKVGAGDRLAAVVKTSGSDEVVVATRHGMAMRFSERDVGASGMSSAPVRGVRLNSHDKVVSAAAIPAGTVVDLLTLTERGHAKRTSIEDFRLQRRGGRGVRAATLNKACGALVTALVVAASDDVLVGSDRRRLSRIPATSVRLQGRASTGSCVAALDPSERVAAAVPVSNR